MNPAAYVYPRLDDPAATQLLAGYAHLDITEIAACASTTHPMVSWYPTATARVDEHHLGDIRAAVLDIAKGEGYPEPTPRRYATFDQKAGTELVREMHIIPADAAHHGVWAFLSLVLMPDIATWRWSPDRHPDRFTGRQHRDTFRRLWSRAYTTGPEASSQLLEDEFTGLMERTTIAGDPRTARAIAETHLTAIRSFTGPRTELLRDAMKRIRRLSVVVHMPALDDNQLRDLLAEAFHDAATALDRQPV